MKYFKGLDTLRAFAVFFVLVEHKGIWFDDTVPTGRFVKQVIFPDGGASVILFFVLSGFLITSILLGQRSEDANKISIVKSFFARRALRIFPIYYLLLFFLYAINYPQIREYFAWHATYTTNIVCYITNHWNSFSHAWSLSVEEQFYLLWPWLIVFVPEKYIRAVFFGAIAIGISSTFYVMNIKGHMGPLLVFNCFDSFGIGGLLAYSLTSEERSKRFRKWINWLAGVALCIYLYWKLAAFFHLPIYGIEFSKIVNSVLSAWLIRAVITARPSAFRRYFLENSVLTFIGKISYGIYLYHYVYNILAYYQINDYLESITLDRPALHSLVHDPHFYYWLHVGLIIAISALSYYAIERPFLSLKKYFDYNKKAPAVPALQAELESTQV